MNKENKMYDYLLEHNYISKNENKNPLRQQELSEERAKCIANKYNNLVKQLEQENKQLETNWNELKKLLEERIKYYKEIGYDNTYLTLQIVLNKMQELEGNNE